jgi:cytochrome c oxidase subunit I
VNLLAVLTTPLPYLLHDVTSGDFRVLMTMLMAWASGLAPILFMVLYMVEGAKGKHPILVTYRHPVGACLYWSLLLFALGGGFAVMIDGINVKIPAHYHGSLLGVTVALMGLTYLVLIAHRFEFLERSRMARWQPALLGVGQVMHIVGLFWSGGYGVQRKSPGIQSDAIHQADLALRVQSTGGGIAIIGGLLFLIVILRAWRKRKHSLTRVTSF